MTFEEEFVRKKIRNLLIVFDFHQGIGKIVDYLEKEFGFDDGKLDKQRVREAIDKEIKKIDKIITPSRRGGKEVKLFLIDLKKELGL